MFDLTAEEARLLLNVGLMAAGGNRFKSAAKIFAVLDRFRPDSPSVAVGKSITLISAMKFVECVDFIDEVALRKFPGNAMLKAFKGMALLRLGRDPEAKVVLAEAADQAGDPAAAQLAKGLLDD